MEKITIDDFKKVEMRVGKIISAERIPESEKLLKLSVDFGSASVPPERDYSETSQVISGIAKSFPEPEILVGREAVFVVNLEPRAILGYESHAMIMAADSPDGPVLLTPEKEVPSGSLIK